MTQTVKNMPATWETWIQSLGWEDPLEAGMATHSSIVAWRISIDRGAWQATAHEIIGHDWGTKNTRSNLVILSLWPSRPLQNSVIECKLHECAKMIVTSLCGFNPSTSFLDKVNVSMFYEITIICLKERFFCDTLFREWMYCTSWKELK